MLDALLPEYAATTESFADLGGDLYPQEAVLVARAVESRRREFLTVRMCARAALAQLGHPAAPIVHDERRAPLWPTGIVGSLTHCTGYRGAAVAHAEDVRAIGIDAEPEASLPDGVAQLVLTAEEREQLRRLSLDSPMAFDRLVFVIKESIYKAWYPIAGRWLGFHDVTVTIDPPGRSAIARRLASFDDEDGFLPREFTSRWTVENGLILAATIVPAEQAAQVLVPSPMNSTPLEDKR
jgi:4'-phosphopantetheinyl transferase EntD